MKSSRLMIFGLIGGLGLFLYGMGLAGDNLQAAAGELAVEVPGTAAVRDIIGLGLPQAVATLLVVLEDEHWSVRCAAASALGLMAYHQWLSYPLMMCLHVLAGDIMLAAIPFTRLSHMLFSPFTRAYMGSEFGKVRHARDW